MTRRGEIDFDHGRFWDSYSSQWERAYDGRELAKQGHVLGTEWGSAEEAQQRIRRFVAPYVTERSSVVEIGPGGGKYSRLLLPICRELTLVDVSSEMLARASGACQGRARTVLIDGTGLAPVPSACADLILSYNVFVHLETEEIFRYFAEANRILVDGGIFTVDGKSFESRYGMMGWLQGIRDHLPQIGQRYGGRQYPLTRSVFHRLAANSGFELVDEAMDWEDSQCVFALRKVSPAYVWRFLTEPELYQAWEICDHIGGTPARPVFAAQARADGSLCLLMIGADAGDGSRPEDRIPVHPAICRRRGAIKLADLELTVYEHVRGVGLGRLLAEPGGVLGIQDLGPDAFPLLVDGLRTAHAAGCAHGGLGPESILYDIQERKLKLLGLSNLSDLDAREASARMSGDREALDRIRIRISERWPIAGAAVGSTSAAQDPER